MNASVTALVATEREKTSSDSFSYVETTDSRGGSEQAVVAQATTAQMSTRIKVHTLLVRSPRIVLRPPLLGDN